MSQQFTRVSEPSLLSIFIRFRGNLFICAGLFAFHHGKENSCIATFTGRVLGIVRVANYQAKTRWLSALCFRLSVCHRVAGDVKGAHLFLCEDRCLLQCPYSCVCVCLRVQMEIDTIWSWNVQSYAGRLAVVLYVGVLVGFITMIINQIIKRIATTNISSDYFMGKELNAALGFKKVLKNSRGT